MPLTSSPPINLASIQSEFSASSLSGAGLAYFGRANCNMLEFLGASSTTYNFTNYSANTLGEAHYADAYVSFSSDGTVTVYYDNSGGGTLLTPSQGYPYGTSRYNWLVTGSGAGVQGYVTRDPFASSYFAQGYGQPTLNTWIPIGDVNFGVSGYGGSNELGSWNVLWRNAQGVSIGSSSITVQLYISEPVGNFGYYYNGSDIRLKRDIVLLETRADGIKVYSFRYKTGEEYYIGVMAQDLLGTQWESAVGTGSDGMYWVDYSKLPVKFELLKK